MKRWTGAGRPSGPDGPYLKPDAYKFDPARDGFGFRNPIGTVPNRPGGAALLRRFDSFLYGGGLCFGMAAAALANHARQTSPLPLAALPLTEEMLEIVRDYHARQLWPAAVLAAVGDWLRARGGRPEGVLERLRLPGESPDPHVLNFGPASNRRFLRCLYLAHTVAPYRIETVGDERRLYVYDPNFPEDRGRYVSFRDDGFGYGGFSTADGWGIALVPLSAIGDTARPPPHAVV